jgi:HD-GYP domain-containing protein (c-di-GMP phosphodiesterase class II)
MMSDKQESGTQSAQQPSSNFSNQDFENPKVALQRRAQETLDLLKVGRITIWTFTSHMEEMRLILARDCQLGDLQTGKIIKTEKLQLFNRNIREGKIFFSDNVQLDESLSELGEVYWVPNNIHSALILPLSWGDEVRAAILFENQDKRRHWSEKTLKSVALARLPIARLLQRIELERSSELLEAIGAVQTGFTLGLEAADLLRRVIELGCKMVDASAGLAFLKGTYPQALRCVVSYQTHNDWKGQIYPDARHPAGVTIRNGLALVLSDYRAWFNEREVFPGEQISSMLSIPVTWKDEVVGVVLFLRQGDAIPLGADDLETLEPLVTQATAAIEMDHYQEKARRTETLQDALREIGEIGDAASFLHDLLNSSLALGCGALGAGISLAWLDDQVVTMGYSIRTGQALIETIRESGLDLARIRAIDDWQRPPLSLASMAPEIIRFGLMSSVIAPFRTGGRRRGILIFGTHEPRIWQPEEIAMVEVAGELICSAAERIEAMQSEQNQRDLLRVLETASKKLNHVRGYANMLSVVGEGAMSLSKSYRAAVFMRQMDDTVEIPWTAGLTRAYVEAVTALGAGTLAPLFDIHSAVMITSGTVSIAETTLRELLQGDTFQAIGLWPMETSDNDAAIMACYYDSQPYLETLDHEVMEIYLRQASTALKNARLYERLEEQYVQTVLSLAKAVDDAESDPTERSMMMAQLACDTGRQIGVSQHELDAINWAAMLHDIGKVSVPKSVLLKPGPLNSQEWEVMQQAPIQGEQYLGKVDLFRGASRLVRHLREHFDGAGYPDRLRGDQIPLGARILAVADAYQAMIEKRPYRKPLTHDEAIDEIKRESGKQFDPRVVNAFIQAAGIGFKVENIQ